MVHDAEMTGGPRQRHIERPNPLCFLLEDPVGIDDDRRIEFEALDHADRHDRHLMTQTSFECETVIDTGIAQRLIELIDT